MASEPTKTQGNDLKHGAIGTIALVFLVVAAAAPLSPADALFGRVSPLLFRILALLQSLYASRSDLSSLFSRTVTDGGFYAEALSKTGYSV